MKPLSAPELAAWLADTDRAKPLLLDVREPWENNVCRIDGSLLAPMQTIPQRVSEWDAAARHGLHLSPWRPQHACCNVFGAPRICERFQSDRRRRCVGATGRSRHADLLMESWMRKTTRARTSRDAATDRRGIRRRAHCCLLRLAAASHNRDSNPLIRAPPPRLATQAYATIC